MIAPDASVPLSPKSPCIVGNTAGGGRLFIDELGSTDTVEGDPFHDEVIPGYASSASIQTTHNGLVSNASALCSKTTDLFRGGYNQNNGGFVCDHTRIDALTGTDTFGNARDFALPVKDNS